MKNETFAVRRIAAVTLLAVALLGILSAIMPLNAFSGDPKAIALLLKTTGNLKLKRTGPAEWISPKKGEILDGGDMLRTGEIGFAAVLFQDDKSLIKMGANTELVINGQREGRAVTKKIWVGAGDLWAKVTKKEGQRFDVETPTSVASVKGTEFYQNVSDGFSSVITMDGEVEFSNDYGSVTVTPGLIGTSTGDKAPEVRKVETNEVPVFGQEKVDNGAGNSGSGGNETEEEIRIEYKDNQGNIKELVIKRKR